MSFRQPEAMSVNSLLDSPVASPQITCRFMTISDAAEMHHSKSGFRLEIVSYISKVKDLYPKP